MTKKRDVHVVTHADGWATKKEGASKAGSVSTTQKAAISKAVEQAKREKVEVVIHRKDGSIRDSDSYGKGPLPPKDQKQWMVSKNNTHVISSGGGWAVRKEGAERASRVFDSRGAAIKHAKSTAKKSLAEVFVHGKDGTIKDRLSFKSNSLTESRMKASGKPSASRSKNG